MKHLIKNNEIARSGIPSHFTRENGEGFWGGYETRTDLHFEDGWRDEVIPEYDPYTQCLGSLYYDQVNDYCTYEVVDLEIDLESEKQVHFNDLNLLRREISILVTEIRLTNDPEPQALVEMAPMVRGLYAFAKQEIQALTAENVRQYVLRGPQVRQLMVSLNQML
jgi:hypothetical protein